MQVRHMAVALRPGQAWFSDTSVQPELLVSSDWWHMWEPQQMFSCLFPWMKIGHMPLSLLPGKPGRLLVLQVIIFPENSFPILQEPASESVSFSSFPQSWFTSTYIFQGMRIEDWKVRKQVIKKDRDGAAGRNSNGHHGDRTKSSSCCTMPGCLGELLWTLTSSCLQGLLSSSLGKVPAFPWEMTKQEPFRQPGKPCFW